MDGPREKNDGKPHLCAGERYDSGSFSHLSGFPLRTEAYCWHECAASRFSFVSRA
jgi:hypothetical protein